MRTLSGTWWLLTLGLCALAYIFLGHNYEQSVQHAAVVFATSAALYALVALIYGRSKRKRRP
jgi:cbb3-type cytochrome oxidase subunit 3